MGELKLNDDYYYFYVGENEIAVNGPDDQEVNIARQRGETVTEGTTVSLSEYLNKLRQEQQEYNNDTEEVVTDLYAIDRKNWIDCDVIKEELRKGIFLFYVRPDGSFIEAGDISLEILRMLFAAKKRKESNVDDHDELDELDEHDVPGCEGGWRMKYSQSTGIPSFWPKGKKDSTTAVKPSCGDASKINLRVPGCDKTPEEKKWFMNRSKTTGLPYYWHDTGGTPESTFDAPPCLKAEQKVNETDMEYALRLSIQGGGKRRKRRKRRKTKRRKSKKTRKTKRRKSKRY